MGTSDPLTGSGPHHLVLFDGVCNLCNGAVQFIIKRDPRQKFRFASLQSAIGQQYVKKLQLTNAPLHSIILIKNEVSYDRSSAVLEIAKDLSGLWSMLYAFKIIPRFIRDALYGWVARNRYRFFGKKDECMIPTPELKARFIE